MAKKTSGKMEGKARKKTAAYLRKGPKKKEKSRPGGRSAV